MAGEEGWNRAGRLEGASQRSDLKLMTSEPFPEASPSVGAPAAGKEPHTVGGSETGLFSELICDCLSGLLCFSPPGDPHPFLPTRAPSGSHRRGKGG